ncbi:MAG: hypothetical protein ABFS21_01395 [Actinomycetota bacterium]
MLPLRIGLPRTRAGILTLGGVAASSASALAFEIALTRVFAVAEFYHFAFLIVSMALLGIGASGTLLTVFPRLAAGGPRRWACLAGLQATAIISAYSVTNWLPFDSFAIAWDRRHLLYLAVYYVALALPFLVGGLIVAVLLTGVDQPEPIASHIIYGGSLVGSGLGCVVAVAGLDAFGGEGTIVLAAVMALAAAAGFAALTERRRQATTVTVSIAAGLVVFAIFVPGLFAMNLSPYKGLSGALRFPGAEIAGTDWDRGTRIDLVRSDGIRSLPGLSFAYAGTPPTQDGVAFDGDDLSPIPRLSPDHAEVARHMMTGLPWLLRPGAGTLVLEPRGGLDVLVALEGGAASVTAVEPHGTAIQEMTGERETVYDDPRVRVSVEDPRTFVERTGETFDVIDLALTAPYRPVTSGAYSLAEDYRITVEAFESYLDRLEPAGILAASRWVQTPPSEEIRLLGVAAEALRRSGADPAASVVMLRSYSNALLLVQPHGWSAGDLAGVRAFAEEQRFDLVAIPGPDPFDANRYNVVPDEQYSDLAAAVLTSTRPHDLYAGYEFDITPPTDDHPFFGHSFKWNQTAHVVDTLGRTWQPFGGAGFLVLVAFLVLATLSSLVLIVAPLTVRRRTGAIALTPGTLRWWTVGYFGLLGFAFLLVEIPLIQSYILLVGDPTTAFAVVLFAVLIASGIGSAISPRIPWVAGAVVLTVMAIASPFLVRSFTQVVLPAPLLVRVIAGAAAIAPLGLLMGTMFPRGVSHLELRAPQLVPWAWGINGAVSVVSAAAAALLALAFGFSAVLMTGAAAYALAALLAASADRSPLVSGEGHE